MREFTFVVALILATTITGLAQARYVTLKFDTIPPNPVPVTNEFSIASYEVAELVSFPNGANDWPIVVIKDGSSFTFDRQLLTATELRQVVVAGPATVRIGSGSGGTKGMCTFKITPESFPPDKTMIIPQGTSGATVTLECSTNLITWGTATNGFYSGTNTAKFFRIRADRAP